MCIVDELFGFMGGIDLCYGRFDTNKHPLFDDDQKLFPGLDYNNVRIHELTR